MHVSHASHNNPGKRAGAGAEAPHAVLIDYRLLSLID